MSATADGPAFDRLDLSALRRRAAAAPWRSLEELADTPEFHRFVHSEFPAFAERLREGVDRRTLIKLMGASLAMAGLAGCDEAEHILPYVQQPEGVVPGVPRYYATSLQSEGYGIGVVVQTREGRPIKVEGNPVHPASLGATDAVMQAATLALYDPDRSRTPMQDGQAASYDAFLRDLVGLRTVLAETRGRRAALLIEPSTSPTLHAQIDALRDRHDGLRIYEHAPLHGDGGRTAFGRPLMQVLSPERAEVILSLDADFLVEGPGRLAYARGFAERRRVRLPNAWMNRLYAVESMPTLTGAAADHPVAVRPSAVPAIAGAIAAAVGGGEVPTGLPVARQWLEVVARDLADAGQRALVVAGEHQHPAVHAAALAINRQLGAIGHTVRMIPPPDHVETEGGLDDLCEAILAGEVDTLFCLAEDPVATAAGDVDAAGAFARLERLVHLARYRGATAALADWHIPAAHEFESWSDLRAFDGTASIVQPLIRPLYQGRTAHELLAAIAGEPDLSSLEIVRAHWADRLTEPEWRVALKRGTIPGTEADPADAPAPAPIRPPPPADSRLEVRFAPDPWLSDGRLANLAWLQELPSPLTKTVWGNVVMVSPATAETYGIRNRQRVRVSLADRAIEGPAWIVPGHPALSVTLTLGHGQTARGPVAEMAVGYDAFRLRPDAAQWMAFDARLEPLDGSEPVISTQHHQSMEDRDIVRHATLEHFRENPDFVRREPPPHESLYPEWEYPSQAWGMSIDQTVCIGCAACVAACQAENNIPTVGPEECERGHEMHWLRVDRYYQGPLDEPQTLFQPVPCMHCEKAPCEVVCPVNATVHTHDGLNAQVYNRCIGTRYCSQNCPYKVRRFNFLQYQPFEDDETGPLQALRNPEVSVRSRGVMEKCTYCVQRISRARIEAKVEDREIVDGELQTACQQACPTQAISFGDLNDPSADVVAAKAAPHDYALMAHLNTRPRTTYLARLRNPHPELHEAEEKKPHESDDG